VGLNSTFLFDTFLKAPSTEKDSPIFSKSLVNNSLSYNFQTPYFYDSTTIELTHSLSKATLALHKLKDSKTFQNFLFSLQKTPHLTFEFMLNDVRDFGFQGNSAWKPKYLTHAVVASKPNFDFQNKSINLTLSDLNELSKNSMSHNLSNLNIYTNLNQSKQNR
jgi:hypothetical protein